MKISDLPPVQRLAKVHRDGIPHDRIFEHFLFCCADTQCCISFFDGDYHVRFRGFLNGLFFDRWQIRFSTPYQRLAVICFNDLVNEIIDYHTYILNNSRGL